MRVATAGGTTLRVDGEGDSVVVREVETGAAGEAVDAGWRVERVNLTDYAGETVTVRALARGNASVRLDYVRVAIDTDGDGLTDPVERADCLRTAVAGVPTCSDTDPTDPDTDGDGLSDARELGTRTVLDVPLAGRVSYFDANSHPESTDTDADGLDDHTELAETQTLEVVVESGNDPHHWNHRDLPLGSKKVREMTVDSDPRFPDTDRDGADDAFELDVLHTDPEQKVTYEITEIHQDRLVEPLVTTGEPTGGCSAQTQEECWRALHFPADPTLTDMTDDFDFVAHPGRDGFSERLRFNALDGTQRTDTWFPNWREVRRGHRPLGPRHRRRRPHRRPGGDRSHPLRVQDSLGRRCQPQHRPTRSRLRR